MKNWLRTLLLLLGDIVTLVSSFFIMLKIAFFGKLTPEIVELHSLPFFLLGILWLIIFFTFNLYDTEKSKPTIPHLRHIAMTFLVATILSMFFFYTIPFFGISPKTNLIIFCISAFGMFIIWRKIFYHIFSSYFKKGIVFISMDVNENQHIKDLESYIQTYPQSGLFVSGKYNSVSEFFIKNEVPPQIFIVTKEVWRNPDNFKKLNQTNSELLDLAHAYEEILSRVPIDAIDEGWFMQNMHGENTNIFDSIKKIATILTTLIVLIILSPILLVIAVSIKLYDGGPIFYSQKRAGKDGKVFNLYKFRSMVVDAEKNGAEWAEVKDSRITPVGKITRRLHIDEIPQMFNVLKGDIALVGPRPERPEFVEKLEKEIPFYYLRHTITPGFTGWAQIKFRYARTVMDSKDKFEYDLYYLKNRNIFMDLGILVRTIQIIFTHIS